MTQANEIVALADQYRAHASMGRHLKPFTDGLGIDLEAIAQPLEIDTALFNEFDAQISLDKFCRLLEALAAITGDDTFGLKYGLFFTFGATGPYGYGLANAPTFRDALDFVVRYTPIVTDFEVLEMAMDDSRITLNWTFSPLITQREQFADFAVTVIVRLFQNCAGSSFRLLSASLERRPPVDKSLHLKTFCKSMSFAAEINELVMPLDLLDIESPSADWQLFEYMSLQCEDKIKNIRQKKDIITLLKADLIQNLEDNDRAIADVARRLGLSERTLQRRLANRGTSFWKVYESTRDELSMRLLQETDVPLMEISRRLGYSSQSAYSRAVKRWHGKSPAQLRADARAD